MASSLQKLLRKSPLTRIISTLYNHPSSNLNPLPFPIQQSNLREADRAVQWVNYPVMENSNSSSPFSQIYPSFPFGFSPNPIFPSGSVRRQTEEDDLGEDDSRKILADSVKKKRKRKMNKHKYRKLRKRLQRKT